MQTQFKDGGVVLGRDLPDDPEVTSKIIYGGWFLEREDSARLEAKARALLAEPLTALGGGDVVAECGHLTHSFCLFDKAKQVEMHRLVREGMPATVRIDLTGIRYKIWGTHFIAAFVPTPAHNVEHLTTNENPHITALRYAQTSPVRSNDMLVAEDHVVVTFEEPVPVLLHAGVVLKR